MQCHGIIIPTSEHNRNEIEEKYILAHTRTHTSWFVFAWLIVQLSLLVLSPRWLVTTSGPPLLTTAIIVYHRNQYFDHNYVTAQDNLNISRGQCGHGRGDTSYTAAAISHIASSANLGKRDPSDFLAPCLCSLTWWPRHGTSPSTPINIDDSSLINGNFPPTTQGYLQSCHSSGLVAHHLQFLITTPQLLRPWPLFSHCHWWRRYLPAPSIPPLVPRSFLPPLRVITRKAWESPALPWE